jgi:hypothetical protein
MEAAYRLGRVLGTRQFGNPRPKICFSLVLGCEDGDLCDGAVGGKERLPIQGLGLRV